MDCRVSSFETVLFFSKVFDVVLNKRHTVVSDLDIFARVGRAAAYDEITKFQILDGELIVLDETSNFKGTLSVEFSKVGLQWLK